MRVVEDDDTHQTTRLEERRAREVSMILEALQKNENSWHLDKKIPVSLIVALIIQSSTIIWWAARTESRLTQIERANATERWVAEVSVRLDILQASVTDSISKERVNLYVNQINENVKDLKEQVKNLRRK